MITDGKGDVGELFWHKDVFMRDQYAVASSLNKQALHYCCLACCCAFYRASIRLGENR